MYGEYLATRALAMAIEGRSDDAMLTARAATETTAGIEARVAALAAYAVVAARGSEPDAPALSLFEAAVEVDLWDMLVTTFRAEPGVLKTLGKFPQTHAQLAHVLRRSHDQPLGRRCGFGVELAYGRRDLLSKREHEVLDLLRQGLTNREIASALFIAESTAKVHVHHIFHKLNVRNRAEAVARYPKTTTGTLDDERGDS
jgi:DNA-binding CsgD family transcriptional regulator